MKRKARRLTLDVRHRQSSPIALPFSESLLRMLGQSNNRGIVVVWRLLRRIPFPLVPTCLDWRFNQPFP